MHTKDQWVMQCDESPDDWPNYLPTISAGDVEIIGTEGFYSYSREQSIADARRVVACVNACAMISTETLEHLVASGRLLSIAGR